MNDPSSSAHEVDQILAQLFAELEHAPDRETVVGRYCQQYPQYAEALREASELDQILGVSTEEVEPPLPDKLGDFRIIRRIAKGGMGIICEAIQEPLDRRVAVKIIRRGRTDTSHRERFLREQRVLARLHQTHCGS
jgi:serine/threonine protein kinase